MDTYNVREFRNSLKKALDKAASGHTVIISRLGQEFYLQLARENVIEGPDGSLRQKTPGKRTVVSTPIIPFEATTTGKKLVEAVEKSASFKQMSENGLCKVHGTPLSGYGKCLQKGCKFA